MVSVTEPDVGSVDAPEADAPDPCPVAPVLVPDDSLPLAVDAVDPLAAPLDPLAAPLDPLAAPLDPDDGPVRASLADPSNVVGEVELELEQALIRTIRPRLSDPKNHRTNVIEASKSLRVADERNPARKLVSYGSRCLREIEGHDDDSYLVRTTARIDPVWERRTRTRSARDDPREAPRIRI